MTKRYPGLVHVDRSLILDIKDFGLSIELPRNGQATYSCTLSDAGAQQILLGIPAETKIAGTMNDIRPENNDQLELEIYLSEIPNKVPPGLPKPVVPDPPDRHDLREPG